MRWMLKSRDWSEEGWRFLNLRAMVPLLGQMVFCTRSRMMALKSAISASAHVGQLCSSAARFWITGRVTRDSRGCEALWKAREYSQVRYMARRRRRRSVLVSRRRAS